MLAAKNQCNNDFIPPFKQHNLTPVRNFNHLAQTLVTKICQYWDNGSHHHVLIPLVLWIIHGSKSPYRKSQRKCTDHEHGYITSPPTENQPILRSSRRHRNKRLAQITHPAPNWLDPDRSVLSKHTSQAHKLCPQVLFKLLLKIH